MHKGLVPAAAALALSTPAMASERAPGDIYYRCALKQRFSLPGFVGGAPIWARPDGRKTPVKPGEAIEQIDASLEVDDKDGALSDLSISWVQSGRLGWPYIWRADLHPVYLIASFNLLEPLPADTPAFDPARLKIEIEVVSERKLKPGLNFRLWRDRRDKEWLSLGGPAHVPAWRKSAEVSIAWPDLAAYAQGDRWLHYELSQPDPVDGYAFRRTVSQGRVDLSIIPALVEEFRKAEQVLRANAAARNGCERQVQPEPSERESI